jgi:hypothetical protein
MMGAYPFLVLTLMFSVSPAHAQQKAPAPHLAFAVKKIPLNLVIESAAKGGARRTAMRCWFWNIDWPNQLYFRTELEQNRLRQGWGYEEKLDLRKIKAKIDKAEELDQEEQAAWSRCQNMLDYIKPDDLVLVKNVPSADKFTITKIAGPYDYRIDPVVDDYGHFLPVLGSRVFSKQAKVVPAPLVNALNRAQAALVPTYKHHDPVVLLYGVSDEEARSRPEEFAERFSKWRQVLSDALKTELKNGLKNPKEAERLIQKMLRRDQGEVRWTAGPKEQGADFIVTIDNGYGLATRMAVQVKMYQDVHDDTGGLDQLEQAFREHHVDTGLLVSFADKIGPNLAKRLSELKQRYKVEVLYGENLFGRLLELLADPDVDPALKD